ncbi:Suppressor of RPS4-RLD 1 [Camellia lanceoleosa]|uniref:Suppressor of RPS4-RLD 1 n=1 Tax=Camellia lanceoleosa TaxID=1840588 RepID=A0ACC0J5C1_9ERIC|nr:Suppressor of RPS4-RLD 1 [Camellia lanceoleosa]
MRWLALFVLWSLVEAAGQTNYGIVNFKFKDFHAAIEDLSASIKLDKDNKSAYTYLGLALSSIGEYRRAEEAHKKSIQLDPNFLEAWAHLTPLYHDLANSEQAVECINQVLQIDGRYFLCSFNRSLWVYRITNSSISSFPCERTKAVVEPGLL